MLEASTLYLVVAMVAFFAVATIFTKLHSTSEDIRRKEGEVQAYSNKLGQKMEVIEREIADLQIDLDNLDEEIESYRTQES